MNQQYWRGEGERSDEVGSGIRQKKKNTKAKSIVMSSYNCTVCPKRKRRKNIKLLILRLTILCLIWETWSCRVNPSALILNYNTRNYNRQRSRQPEKQMGNGSLEDENLSRFALFFLESSNVTRKVTCIFVFFTHLLQLYQRVIHHYFVPGCYL